MAEPFLSPNLGPRPVRPEVAFERLVEVVRELQRTGRSTRSAGVKPRLIQALGGKFDEIDYGFATFREFLTAAQQAGIVELRSTGTSPDVDVILSDESPTGAMIPSGRIRPDLWSTFMDWSPGIERLWDRKEQRARRLVPITDTEQFDSDMRALEEAKKADPDRFVKIEPVALATQLTWARNFVAGLDSMQARTQLTEDLNTERPLQEFTRRIRTMPSASTWASYRNRQVAEVIRRWAKDQEIDVDPFAPAPMPPPTVLSSARSVVVHSGAEMHAPIGIDVAALRAQAKDLIDRMTVEELLALPLTLGQLYRR